MSQKVAIIDGVHFTDNLEEAVNAYYARPNSQHANLFKEELENKGIAIRAAGHCATGCQEVLFLARRSQGKYAYQNILFPRLYHIARPSKDMISIVDGVHTTEAIDEVINAYHFDSESENAIKFRQELEEKGYASREVGGSHAENIKVLFEAKKNNTKFDYRTIILPPTTTKRIVINISGVYRG